MQRTKHFDLSDLEQYDWCTSISHTPEKYCHNPRNRNSYLRTNQELNGKLLFSGLYRAYKNVLEIKYK